MIDRRRWKKEVVEHRVEMEVMQPESGEIVLHPVEIRTLVFKHPSFSIK